jgi:hypothetical protein
VQHFVHGVNIVSGAVNPVQRPSEHRDKHLPVSRLHGMVGGLWRCRARAIVSHPERRLRSSELRLGLRIMGPFAGVWSWDGGEPRGEPRDDCVK